MTRYQALQQEPGTLIEPAFLQRSVLKVAPDLIGQWLCRRLPDGSIIREMITEVEAYDGTADKACHAHKGKTPRTAVMFGPSGYFYVYLCYGVHWLLNIVTDEVDYPAAVLIRGVGAIRGPGRVTKALAIDKAFNCQPVAQATGLWLESSGLDVSKRSIEKTPRIGIDYAGPIWAAKPYRFVLKDVVWKKIEG